MKIQCDQVDWKRRLQSQKRIDGVFTLVAVVFLLCLEKIEPTRRAFLISTWTPLVWRVQTVKRIRDSPFSILLMTARLKSILRVVSALKLVIWHTCVSRTGHIGSVRLQWSNSFLFIFAIAIRLLLPLHLHLIIHVIPLRHMNFIQWMNLRCLLHIKSGVNLWRSTEFL